MDTREISRAEWPSFFDAFSQSHCGQLVTVESMAPKLGIQYNVRDGQLVGLTAEPDAADGGRIVIMTERPPGHNLEHAIRRPSHVRLAEWNRGVSAALQIEAEEGLVTLVVAGPAEETRPPVYAPDDDEDVVPDNGKFLPPIA
jgi:hypothetical protein